MADLRKKLYADGKFYYPLSCKVENNSLSARLPGGPDHRTFRIALGFRGNLDISSLFESIWGDGKGWRGCGYWAVTVRLRVTVWVSWTPVVELAVT
jgi:hypothetical protein